MRGLSIAFAVFLSASVAAVAEETPPSVDRLAPAAVAAEPEADAPDAAASGPASEETRAARVEKLIETLRTTKDGDAGREAERALLELWLASGSDTVDLLMNWSLKAMQGKNYPLALDFLDRIIIMKPDYVEGWNKRATVYFMRDDYGRALADIARVLELEPRHFGALSGLGLIFRAVGRDEQAIAAYRQALEIDPFLDNVKEALDELEAETAGSGI